MSWTGNWPVHTGVPSYFRAACREARNGCLLGGQGYRAVGYMLATHTRREEPLSVESEEWDECLDALAAALAARDRAEVRAWYTRTYPRFVALVPRRSRDAFLDGVFGAYKDEEMDL